MIGGREGSEVGSGGGDWLCVGVGGAVGVAVAGSGGESAGVELGCGDAQPVTTAVAAATIATRIGERFDATRPFCPLKTPERWRLSRVLPASKEARSMARSSGDRRFDGDQYAYRIDNIGGDQVNIFNAGGIHAIQATGGVAKLFVILGLLVSYAGAAMFLYVVVSFIVTIWGTMGSPEPPDMSAISELVVPWLPVGIGLAFVGGVIGSIALAVGRPRYR